MKQNTESLWPIQYDRMLWSLITQYQYWNMHAKNESRATMMNMLYSALKENTEKSVRSDMWEWHNQELYAL